MVTVERDMRSTADAVLAVLADGWSYATWVVGTSRLRGVDPQWPAPGARIAHSFGVWPAVVDDTTHSLGWDPQRGIRLRARGWPAGEAEVHVEVVPLTSGCRVRLAEDAVRGPGTLVPRPLREVVLRARNRETLARLDRLAGRPAT